MASAGKLTRENWSVYSDVYSDCFYYENCERDTGKRSNLNQSGVILSYYLLH
jgi:hypothetical protein